MAYRAKFSELAAEDLDEIMRYFCEELLMPQAAGRFYNSVDKQLGLISDNPQMYPLHHDEKLRAAGLRFVTIGKYIMFYSVDDCASEVIIVRVVYGGRDFSSVF